MRQRTSPARVKGVELDNNFRESNSSTNTTKLNATRDGRKVLKQIARKWAARGYYPTPSAAMRVLLEGVDHE